ncbi:hypothetical protein [Paraoerskovia marina]|uniref:hypothetical protein n=1 Tax=Paraoerskovia marina TaxID=545619 RepID=UPI000492B157|nr:hypothetical protein [Paraoerskovia marina]
MTDTGYGDFEFERRFLLRHVPRDLVADVTPSLVVQSYFLADEGYALRVRVQATSTGAVLDSTSDPLEVLAEHAEAIDFCTLTAKGPTAGGTRYEAERELDVLVGLEMVRRRGRRIVKNRYAVWLGEDGWVVDEFGGANHPLVIAECERSGPVTDLEIPQFCTTEITDDVRFGNESLACRPYASWAADHLRQLDADGPQYRQDFGENSTLRDGSS